MIRRFSEVLLLLSSYSTLTNVCLIHSTLHSFLKLNPLRHILISKMLNVRKHVKNQVLYILLLSLTFNINGFLVLPIDIYFSIKIWNSSLPFTAQRFGTFKSKIWWDRVIKKEMALTHRIWIFETPVCDNLGRIRMCGSAGEVCHQELAQFSKATCHSKFAVCSLHFQYAIRDVGCQVKIQLPEVTYHLCSVINDY